MSTRYEFRNRRQAPAPARNTAQRKRAAPVLSKPKMKEVALWKRIEARYAEIKACVAGNSFEAFEVHDRLDMFMIQHAIHFRENPFDKFLYDNTREIRFRDPLAMRCFVAQAANGELYVPGIPPESTLPVFGQPASQVYPHIREGGEVIQKSANRGLHASTSAKSRPPSRVKAPTAMHRLPATPTSTITIADDPPAGADSVHNTPYPSPASEKSASQASSQQTESSDSESSTDTDDSSPMRNNRPSGIVLKLTGLQSPFPKIQALKRKTPEEDVVSEAPAAKRSRTTASPTSESSVSTEPAQQTPEQESTEGATSSASSTSTEGSSSDDKGPKPQRRGNKSAATMSTRTVAVQNSNMASRKRDISTTDSKDDSSDSQPVKRRRANNQDPAGSSSSTKYHRRPGPSKAPPKASKASTKASKASIKPTAVSKSAVANPTADASASSTATASTTAPTSRFRTRDDPAVGENGFQLIGKQHFFTVGHDQTEHLTQRYTVIEHGVRSAVRTHTWEGNRGKTAADIDWNDKKTISRLNQWLAQWMRRSCGCGTMRPNVNKLRWTEEEYGWLRAYVADHPERPSRNQVTAAFNEHFRGRVLTYTDHRGELQTMPARGDRQTEAIFTAMDRRKIGWRHLEK